LLVPIVFACELLLPAQADLHVGVGEALGCSGSSSVAPPSTGFLMLRPRLPGDANSRVVPVATDGFFAIDATAYQLTAAAVTSGLKVVVKNAAGETVAGETKLLSGEQGPQFVFGWSATTPLELGAELKANLSATPLSTSTGNVGGDYQLEVKGEPTPLPEPSFTFSSWLDYFHGVEGALVSCQTVGGVCTPGFMQSVPATLEKQRAADVTWRLPPITGGVAWEARVEAPKTPGDADLDMVYPMQYLGIAPAGGLPLGRAVFPTPGDKYCATLVVTDLRTKQEKRAEVCESAKAPQGAATDTELESCTAPPSTTLAEAWCALHPGSNDPACQAQAGGSAGGPNGSGGSVASGGSTSQSGSGAGHDDVVGTGGSVASPATNNAVDGAHTSQGCQLGSHAPSPASGATLSLLLLALFVRRRSSACS
jgi:hypothetical protein